MDAIGWIGSMLFALCGLPQAIASFRQKHSNGLTWAFLLMWLFGEILTTIYIWPKQDYPLLANYAINFLFLTVIIYYKALPRKV